METMKPRKRAGRPKGTGYPKDVERIGLVRDALSSGEFPSRRAAIVAVVGPDPSDIRRMERKMTDMENDKELEAYKRDVEKASDHVDLTYLDGGTRPDEQELQGIDIGVGNLIGRCGKVTGDDWGGDVLLLERIASALISANDAGFSNGAEHCMAVMTAALQRLAEKEHYDPMFRQHVPAERFDILIQPGHRPLVRHSSAESRPVGKEAA